MTRKLLFLALGWGCGWPRKEEVLTKNSIFIFLVNRQVGGGILFGSLFRKRQARLNPLARGCIKLRFSINITMSI